MTKGIKRMAVAMTAAAVMTGMLAGCGQSSGSAGATSTAAATADAGKKVKEVTVRYGLWGSEEEQKIQRANAENCEKTYPGVKIEVSAYPDSATFWQKLPAEVAAKTSPDVIQVTNEGHLEYIAKGAFVPVNDQIKEAGIDMSKVPDSAKNIWTVDGKLYGLPTSVIPEMFFINKDLWDAAGLGDKYPQTTDDIRTAAKAMTKGNVKGLILNINEFHLTQYALAFGGGWGNGKTINSEANIKAMEWVVSMFKDGLAVTPKQTGNGWDGEVFAAKKGAMSTGGYWYKGFMKGSAPDVKYVAMPIPKAAAQSCTLHSTGLVVLKDAADKTAAVKAAAYLARPDALSKLMDGIGICPANTDISSKYFTVNPEFKSIEPMIPLGKDFGYPAQDTKRFTDALVSAMESKILTNSNKSVKDILDELQKQFNK